MFDAALNIGDASAGVALVPEAVEVLRSGPELNDEVAGQVLWFGFASFLTPQADQSSLVTAHDDSGVRAADEATAVTISQEFRADLGHSAVSVKHQSPIDTKSIYSYA
jgi:hypothetical protein